MKILTVSNLYPPNAVGGYETLCFDVMQELAAKGHEITVLTSCYGGNESEYPGQLVLRKLTLLADSSNIYQPFRPTSAELARINRLNIELFNEVVASINPDVVFLWNLFFLDSSFLEAVERCGQRKVYFLTDNWLIYFHAPSFVAKFFADITQDGPSGIGKLFRSLRFWVSSDKSRLRYFSSSAIFASRFMVEFYRRAGIRFAKRSIIYHGIKSAHGLDFMPEVRGELVAPKELRLLFAGRIVEIKGVHTAIMALPAIMQALPNFRVSLMVMGDDRDLPYLSRLRQLVSSLRLDSVVCFSAPVPEAALPEIFCQYDIYLFPSLYEPFSLTLIHALRAGIPTVASSAGGNPEIVFHGKTGMLFAAGNQEDLARQVIALATSDKLRVKLSKRASEHARKFDFSRMISEVEDHLLTVSRV